MSKSPPISLVWREPALESLYKLKFERYTTTIEWAIYKVYSQPYGTMSKEDLPCFNCYITANWDSVLTLVRQKLLSLR